MSKHLLSILLLILPVAFVVTACASVLDVDFGAAHLDDDASVTGEGGITLGDGGKANCLPKTCQMQGFECGTQNDGCGDALLCGTCKAGTCTGGKCSCVPKTCPELKVSCGKVDNGCGALLDCGGCPNPTDACDAQTNTCQCKPKNCTAQGAACGSVPDGCGQTYACGTCMDPQKPNCNAGKCSAAACIPKSCKEQGKNCGQVTDGCGTVLDCGMCSGTDSCGGAGVANVCGCTAKTCPQLGANCGTPSNGCGGALSCGNCALPNTCGGGGATNVCGCTPTGKCPAGANCGTVPNNCGGNVACGAACASPNTCGGGGSANVCGCTPLTCADYTCGVAVTNGCGGTLNCGPCGGGGCFAEETPVMMADGTLRPIASIKPGDVIMGFDQATMQAVPRTVERLMIHPAEDSPTGTVVLNGSIRATRNHPFLNNGRGVRADLLKVGDVVHVALARGGRVSIAAKPITSVTMLEGGIRSYDIRTSPPGGYIVGNEQTIVLQKVIP